MGHEYMIESDRFQPQLRLSRGDNGCYTSYKDSFRVNSHADAEFGR
jgi:hypothetical protein